MFKILHRVRRLVSGFSMLKKIYLTIFRLLPVHTRYELNRKLRSPYSSLEEENKIIFIHIPKAAGNALIKSLYGRAATGHDPVSRYKSYNADKFSSYYKFAVVRNPWDRVVSSYHYLKQGGMGFFDNDFSDGYLSEVDNFEEFIYRLRDDALFRGKVMTWVHFVPQIDFLSLDGEYILVDKIVKLEEIEVGFKELCVELNAESMGLIKDNRSNRSKYQDYYNSKTIEIVRGLYSTDIKLLNYQFGSSK